MSRHRFWSPRPVRPRPLSTRLAFEDLEGRLTPAVTASFAANTGVLAIVGDGQSNTLTVSRDAAGTIVVNGGAVSATGGTATVGNTTLIRVLAHGGNDTITLDEANGALPRAELFGGSGSDTITGGSGGDQLFGEAGNDTLLGKGGFDSLLGGVGSDVLTGGDADDQVFGQSGNDRMIWNPGDDTDLNEGGAGVDTIEVIGGGGGEQFAVTANGARVRFDRVTPAPFSIDIGTSENLILNTMGGDDSFSALGIPAGLIKLTVDGGLGNDSIEGGNGGDDLSGGDGDDTVEGGLGIDKVFLGNGNDLFSWNPGDGNDQVEGQDGFDSMAVSGSGADEAFVASANGPRLRLTRNVSNVVLSVDGVERVDVDPLGGADTMTLNDLTGTAVQELRVDLEAVQNGGAADDKVDRVILNGTTKGDIVSVLGQPGNLFVLGLPTFVTLQRAAVTDQLTINTLDGNDRVEGGSVAAEAITFAADGGAGSDILFGTNGANVLIGGAGTDFVDGQRGNDTILLGADNDTFVWERDDGNDVIEGGTGFDGLRVSGSSAAERATLSAVGQRLRFNLDVDNLTLDANDIEVASFLSFGGADTVVVNDLAGTDVDQVDISLFDFGVAGGNTDVVVVNGTAGNNTIKAASANGIVTVSGLSAQVRITGTDAAGDRLEVNGLAGNDSIDSTALEPAEMRFLADGGAGNDVFTGGDGDDVLLGGDGADVIFTGSGDNVAFGGAGDDVLRGEEGDDVLDGGAGDDVLIGGAGDDVLLNGEVVFDE